GGDVRRLLTPQADQRFPQPRVVLQQPEIADLLGALLRADDRDERQAFGPSPPRQIRQRVEDEREAPEGGSGGSPDLEQPRDPPRCPAARLAGVAVVAAAHPSLHGEPDPADVETVP